MNLLRTYNQHPPQKKALKLCKTYNTMVFGNLLKGHTMFPLKASKSLFHLRLGVVALSVISTTRFIKLSRRQVLRPHESAECFPSATLPVKSHTGTSNKAQNTIFYAWGNIGIAGIAWIAFTKHLNLPKTVFEMHYPAFIKNPFYKQNNNNKKTLFWSLKTFFTPPGPADDCVEKKSPPLCLCKAPWPRGPESNSFPRFTAEHRHDQCIPLVKCWDVSDWLV